MLLLLFWWVYWECDDIVTLKVKTITNKKITLDLHGIWVTSKWIYGTGHRYFIKMPNDKKSCRQVEYEFHRISGSTYYEIERWLNRQRLEMRINYVRD